MTGLDDSVISGLTIEDCMAWLMKPEFFEVIPSTCKLANGLALKKIQGKDKLEKYRELVKVNRDIIISLTIFHVFR